MKHNFRCMCPVTSALDIFGDKWTLVIVKQMLLQGKKTFKDFFESDEIIATNILSTRLKMLQKHEIIFQEKLPDNKKTNIYLLTEKGLGLTAIILELYIWSEEHIKDVHPNLYLDARMEIAKNNKEGFVNILVANYKKENYLKAISDLDNS